MIMSDEFSMRKSEDSFWPTKRLTVKPLPSMVTFAFLAYCDGTGQRITNYVFGQINIRRIARQAR